MPGYGSPYSPSIRKMEHSRPYRRGFQMANILGDPFALATLSIASLAWFIAFVGTIFGQVNDSKDSHTDGPFPKFAWWSVFYTLLLNSGIFVIIGSDAVQTYHVAVTAYAAAGHVLVASSVHGLIYAHSASREAAAAGFVLLAMVDILWVFYFGSTPASTPRAFIDSFALTKESAMHQQSLSNYGATGRPETSHSVQPPQMYNSSQHTGFDNPSPIGGGTRTSNIQAPSFANTPAPQPTQNKSPVADAEVVPPSDYPYRAKAIYSYDANPEDANEISFSKHEILEVSDISGRWWQAKKENGETGIAPSNYLVLV